MCAAVDVAEYAWGGAVRAYDAEEWKETEERIRRWGGEGNRVEVRAERRRGREDVSERNRGARFNQDADVVGVDCLATYALLKHVRVTV